MPKKIRSSKSTRVTKRTKRRVFRKTGVSKSKKKSSRKKSKKSIVRKRKTSNDKKNIVMKGGVLEIMCGTKKIKIEDAALDAKLLNFKPSDNSPSNPKICIYDLTNTAKTEQYKMHCSSNINDNTVSYINIQNNLSEKQKESSVKYVPNILYFERNEKKKYVIMIEEHFTKSPQLRDTDDEGILDLLIKMAKCVEFLHSNNIVHSRIFFKNFKKSGNNIIITDFSMSFYFTHYSYVPNVEYLEYDPATFQNIGYDTAPEVKSEEHFYNNRELLKKRDVFSFGIMLREILKLDIITTDKLKLALNEIIVNCTEANPIKRNTFTEIIKLLELERDEEVSF